MVGAFPCTSSRPALIGSLKLRQEVEDQQVGEQERALIGLRTRATKAERKDPCQCIGRKRKLLRESAWTLMLFEKHLTGEVDIGLDMIKNRWNHPKKISHLCLLRAIPSWSRHIATLHHFVLVHSLKSSFDLVFPITPRHDDPFRKSNKV
jgi:hypothetical protein